MKPVSMDVQLVQQAAANEEEVMGERQQWEKDRRGEVGF